MTVIDVNALEAHAKEHSDNKHIIRRDDLKISLVSVRPGSSIPSHAHAKEEQFYYVLEGEGNLTLGDEMYALRPGIAVGIPPGVPHEVSNPSEKPLRYLDFFIAK